MSKVLSGLLAEYYLALLGCDGPPARFAIELYPMGLQWWAARNHGGFNAKAVLCFGMSVFTAEMPRGAAQAADIG